MNFLHTTNGKHLLDKFLSNYRLSSFKVYQSEIKQFFEFYQKDIHELKEKDILKYRDELLSKVSASSLTRKISILSKFFLFIEKHIEGFKNPISSKYGSQTKYHTNYKETDRYNRDINKWLNNLQLTQKTKETYKINVNLFFDWFKRPVKEITLNVMMEYREYLNSKYACSTIFHIGIEKTSKILSFKELRLIPPRKDKGYYQVLNIDEMQSIINQTDKSMFGIRNKAILRLMCTYGLRVNEVCKLKYGDFEHERINGQQKLWIRDRKGKATQRANTAIILSGKVLKAIDEWLGFVNRKIDVDDETPIFNQFKWNMHEDCLELNINKIIKKRPLTVKAIQNIIEKYTEAAKIKRKFKITPHALRHSALTILAKSGVDLIDLKYLAGHQSINTTMIYIHSVQSYDDHVGLHHPLNNN
jgi:site-specific recombinase XerD